jgi:hypothetical protein
MKQQDNNPLDELFASLAEPKAEAPSAAFLQDVETRLDALAQKRRKPLAIWWVWSALGAVLTFGSILFWQGAQDGSVPSSAKQVTRKTQRVSGAKNTKVATYNLNLSKSNSSKRNSSKPKSSKLKSPKPNSSNSFNTSNPTSPSVGSFISETYSILASDFQGIPQTNTFSIDTNGLAKANQQPVIASISTHPKESAKPTKKSQSLGLQFGVSGIFSSFEVPSGSYAIVPPFTPKELREWRELGERQTSSWDFNLRYQLFFGQWGLQTGLSYLEWGEQYTYKVISVEGTNRYQYVQIPLGLSYQIPLRKVLLQPGIGLGLGYGVRRDGAYILPNNNGVAVVESKKWATNAYAQLELIYQVNAQLQFSLAPMFRYSLGRIVSDEVIKNRYQSLGLLTGFSFAF